MRLVPVRRQSTRRPGSSMAAAAIVASEIDGRDKLWTSDGTTAGTSRITGFGTQSDLDPGWLAALGSRLLFAANDTQVGRELWVR